MGGTRSRTSCTTNAPSMRAVRPSTGIDAHDSTKLERMYPFFIVSGVEQTIAFCRDELGFETWCQEPDRSHFFAIVGRDGAMLFVKAGEAAPLPRAALTQGGCPDMAQADMLAHKRASPVGTRPRDSCFLQGLG